MSEFTSNDIVMKSLAAAIIGVDRAMQLLADWKRGEPVRFRTSTIVNGLTLDAPLSPRKDIEIVPLPLTTTELPRLPSHNNLIRACIHYAINVVKVEDIHISE